MLLLIFFYLLQLCRLFSFFNVKTKQNDFVYQNDTVNIDCGRFSPTRTRDQQH